MNNKWSERQQKKDGAKAAGMLVLECLGWIALAVGAALAAKYGLGDIIVFILSGGH